MSDRVTRRHPDLGCSVLHHVVKTNSLRTPEAIAAETDRYLADMERRAKRQWAPILKGDAAAVVIILACLAILWAIGG